MPTPIKGKNNRFRDVQNTNYDPYANMFGGTGLPEYMHDDLNSFYDLSDVPKKRGIITTNNRAQTIKSIYDKQAAEQGAGAKIFNGVGRLIGKGLSAGVGGLAMIPTAAYGVIKGDLNKTFDNGIHNFLRELDKDIEQFLPIYTNTDYDNKNIGQKVGTLDFWMRDFLGDGMSFVLGAVISETAAATLTAGTLGAGAPVLGLTTANILSKLPSVFKFAGAAKSGGKALTFGRQLITGSFYEAGVEAAHYKEQALTKLKQSEQQKLGRLLDEDELQGIESFVNKSANTVFMANAALVHASNLMTLGRTFNSGVNDLISGVTGMTGVSSLKGLRVNTGGKGLLNKAKAKIASNPISKGTYSVLKPFVSEGIIEEAGQSAISEGALDYAVNSYSPNAQSEALKIIQSSVDKYAGNIGTKEFYENVVLGGLIGMVGSPTFINKDKTTGAPKIGLGWQFGVKNAWDELTEAKNYEDRKEKVEKTITDTIKNRFKSVTGIISAYDKLNQAIDDKDIFSAKNAESEILFRKVNEAYNTGALKHLRVQLKELAKNNDLMGLDQEFDYNNGSTKEEILDRKKKVAEKTLKQVDQFLDAIKQAKKILPENMHEDVVEAMAFSIAQERDSDNRRKDIIKDLSSKSIELDEKINPLLEGLNEGYITGTVIRESKNAVSEAKKSSIGLNIPEVNYQAQHIYKSLPKKVKNKYSLEDFINAMSSYNNLGNQVKKTSPSEKSEITESIKDYQKLLAVKSKLVDDYNYLVSKKNRVKFLKEHSDIITDALKKSLNLDKNPDLTMRDVHSNVITSSWGPLESVIKQNLDVNKPPKKAKPQNTPVTVPLQELKVQTGTKKEQLKEELKTVTNETELDEINRIWSNIRQYKRTDTKEKLPEISKVKEVIEEAKNEVQFSEESNDSKKEKLEQIQKVEELAEQVESNEAQIQQIEAEEKELKTFDQEENNKVLINDPNSIGNIRFSRSLSEEDLLYLMANKRLLTPENLILSVEENPNGNSFISHNSRVKTLNGFRKTDNTVNNTIVVTFKHPQTGNTVKIGYFFDPLRFYTPEGQLIDFNVTPELLFYINPSYYKTQGDNKGVTEKGKVFLNNWNNLVTLVQPLRQKEKEVRLNDLSKTFEIETSSYTYFKKVVDANNFEDFPLAINMLSTQTGIDYNGVNFVPVIQYINEDGVLSPNIENSVYALDSKAKEIELISDGKFLKKVKTYLTLNEIPPQLQAQQYFAFIQTNAGDYLHLPIKTKTYELQESQLIQSIAKVFEENNDDLSEAFNDDARLDQTKKYLLDQQVLEGYWLSIDGKELTDNNTKVFTSFYFSYINYETEKPLTKEEFERGDQYDKYVKVLSTITKDDNIFYHRDVFAVEGYEHNNILEKYQKSISKKLGFDVNVTGVKKEIDYDSSELRMSSSPKLALNIKAKQSENKPPLKTSFKKAKAENSTKKSKADSVEIKKADIEKRRQEELEFNFGKNISLIKSGKLPVIERHSIYSKKYPNGVGLNRKAAEKLVSDYAQINKKYDDELSELEKSNLIKNKEEGSVDQIKTQQIIYALNTKLKAYKSVYGLTNDDKAKNALLLMKTEAQEALDAGLIEAQTILNNINENLSNNFETESVELETKALQSEEKEQVKEKKKEGILEADEIDLIKTVFNPEKFRRFKDHKKVKFREKELARLKRLETRYKDTEYETLKKKINDGIIYIEKSLGLENQFLKKLEKKLPKDKAYESYKMTQTQEFKDWFEGSVIVDENGDPEINTIQGPNGITLTVFSNIQDLKGHKNFDNYAESNIVKQEETISIYGQDIPNIFDDALIDYEELGVNDEAYSAYLPQYISDALIQLISYRLKNKDVITKLDVENVLEGYYDGDGNYISGVVDLFDPEENDKLKRALLSLPLSSVIVINNINKAIYSNLNDFSNSSILKEVKNNLSTYDIEMVDFIVDTEDKDEQKEFQDYDKSALEISPKKYFNKILKLYISNIIDYRDVFGLAVKDESLLKELGLVSFLPQDLVYNKLSNILSDTMFPDVFKKLKTAASNDRLISVFYNQFIKDLANEFNVSVTNIEESLLEGEVQVFNKYLSNPVFASFIRVANFSKISPVEVLFDGNKNVKLVNKANLNNVIPQIEEWENNLLEKDLNKKQITAKLNVLWYMFDNISLHNASSDSIELKALNKLRKKADLIELETIDKQIYTNEIKFVFSDLGLELNDDYILYSLGHSLSAVPETPSLFIQELQKASRLYSTENVHPFNADHRQVKTKELDTLTLLKRANNSNNFDEKSFYSKSLDKNNPESRLRKIAEANAFFDNKTSSVVFKNSVGDTLYDKVQHSYITRLFMHLKAIGQKSGRYYKTLMYIRQDSFDMLKAIDILKKDYIKYGLKLTDYHAEKIINNMLYNPILMRENLDDVIKELKRLKLTYLTGLTIQKEGKDSSEVFHKQHMFTKLLNKMSVFNPRAQTNPIQLSVFADKRTNFFPLTQTNDYVKLSQGNILLNEKALKEVNLHLDYELQRVENYENDLVKIKTGEITPIKEYHTGDYYLEGEKITLSELLDLIEINENGSVNREHEDYNLVKQSLLETSLKNTSDKQVRGLKLFRFKNLPIAEELIESIFKDTEIEQEKIDKAIQELYITSFRTFLDLLSKASIINYDKKTGRIVNNLLPNTYLDQDNDISEALIASYFFNDFINSMNYNSLMYINVGEGHRNVTDVVKRNGNLLSSGPIMGYGQTNYILFEPGERAIDEADADRHGINESVDYTDGQSWTNVKWFKEVYMRSTAKYNDEIVNEIELIEYGLDQLFDVNYKLIEHYNLWGHSKKLVQRDELTLLKTSVNILQRANVSKLTSTAVDHIIKENLNQKQALKYVKNLINTEGINSVYDALPNRQELHDMYNTMIQKNVGFVVTPSAMKTNKQGIIKDLSNFNDNVINFFNNITLLEQTITDGFKTKVTHGTQLMSLVWSEVDDTVFSNINGTNYSGSKLSEAYKSILAKRIENGLDSKLKELYNKDIDTNIDSVDYNKLIDTIINGLKTVSGDPLLETILSEHTSVSGVKSPKYNYNFSVVQPKLQAYFQSFISDNLFSQKIEGRKFTLVSSYGYNIRRVLDKTTRLNKTELDNLLRSDEKAASQYVLHEGFYYKQVKTLATNENLNNFTKEELQELKQLKLDLMSSLTKEDRTDEEDFKLYSLLEQYSKMMRFSKDAFDQHLGNDNLEGLLEELEDLNPITEDNPNYIFTHSKLRHKVWDNVSKVWYSEAIASDMSQSLGKIDFGVRIPTQGNGFMANLKYVDTMPKFQGNNLVIPDELVLTSGADFDIDAKYVHSKKESYGDYLFIEDDKKAIEKAKKDLTKKIEESSNDYVVNTDEYKEAQLEFHEKLIKEAPELIDVTSVKSVKEVYVEAIKKLSGSSSLFKKNKEARHFVSLYKVLAKDLQNIRSIQTTYYLENKYGVRLLSDMFDSKFEAQVMANRKAFKDGNLENYKPFTKYEADNALLLFEKHLLHNHKTASSELATLEPLHNLINNVIHGDKTKPQLLTFDEIIGNKVVEDINATVIKNKGLTQAASSSQTQVKPVKSAELNTGVEIYKELGSKTESGNVKVVKNIFANKNNRGIITAFRVDKKLGLLESFRKYNAIGNPINWQGFKPRFEGNNNISTFTNYSGAAKGGDTVWENVGKEFGLGKQVNYRPEDLNRLTKEQLQEVESAYQQAVKDLSRKPLAANTFAGGLVRRDYLQAKAADAVFAISTIVEPGQKDSKGYVNKTNKSLVAGGTGYAVQMAINLGKPVYVFDQNKNEWFVWNNNTFEKTETPTLTSKFAGIGTREINENGKRAIRDVYEKTTSNQQTDNATIAFIDWLLGNDYTNLEQEYRQEILNRLGSLKGKTIEYYKELGRPSHATALDYLINKDAVKNSNTDKQIAPTRKVIQSGMLDYGLLNEENVEFLKQESIARLSEQGYHVKKDVVYAHWGYMWAVNDKGADAFPVFGKHLKRSNEKTNLSKGLNKIDLPKAAINQAGSAQWYDYYTADQDGKPLPKVPQKILDIIQDHTGIDTSIYDAAIINAYGKNRNLAKHIDNSEDKSASVIPIISISLLDDGTFMYSDPNSNPNVSRQTAAKNKIVLKDGQVISFGGKSRFISHRMDVGNGKTVPINTTTGNINTNRINITLRRVMPLTKEEINQWKENTIKLTEELKSNQPVTKQNSSQLLSNELTLSEYRKNNFDYNTKFLQKVNEIIPEINNEDVELTEDNLKALFADSKYLGQILKLHNFVSSYSGKKGKISFTKDSKKIRGAGRHRTDTSDIYIYVKDRYNSSIETTLLHELLHKATTYKLYSDKNAVKLGKTLVNEILSIVTQDDIDTVGYGSTGGKRLSLLLYALTGQKVESLDQINKENISLKELIPNTTNDIIKQWLKSKPSAINKNKTLFDKIVSYLSDLLKSIFNKKDFKTLYDDVTFFGKSILDDSYTGYGIKSSLNSAPKPKKSYTLLNGFTATEDQANAIEKINEFLNAANDGGVDSQVFTLKGRGGTGKTSVIDTALAERSNILYLAPTHKAASVLSDNTGEEARTVQSALFLRPKFINGQRKFVVDQFAKKNGDDLMKSHSIIVIDESSMISDEMFDKIIESIRPDTKVIFMGDNVQTPPVEQDHASKTFDYTKAELFERVRQKDSSPILPLTDIIAQNVESDFPVRRVDDDKIGLFDKPSNEGLIFVGMDQFEAMARSWLRDIGEHPESTKLITYNNENHNHPQSVKNLNDYFRNLYIRSYEKTLVGDYFIGEQFTAYATLANDNGDEPLIKNSVDYTIISLENKKSTKKLISVSSKKKGYRSINIELDTQFTGLKNNQNGQTVYLDIPTISGKQKLNAQVQKLFKTDAQLAYAVLEEFPNLEFGYAITSIKSQGSTYRNAYVFQSNILGKTGPRSPINANKNLYTAYSRASRKLVVFTDEPHRNKNVTFDSALDANTALNKRDDRVTLTLDSPVDKTLLQNANDVGAANIAPVARYTVLHQMLATLNIKLPNSIKLLGAYDTFKFQASGVFDRTNSVINMLLSAMTDNAKHQDSSALNFNTQSLGAALVMTGLGVPINLIALMWQQRPIIKFIETQLKANSPTLEDDDLSSFSVQSLFTATTGLAVDYTQWYESILQVGKRLTEQDLINNYNVTKGKYLYKMTVVEVVAFANFLMSLDAANQLRELNPILDLMKKLKPSIEVYDSIENSLSNLGLVYKDKDLKVDHLIQVNGIAAKDMLSIIDNTPYLRSLIDAAFVIKNEVLPDIFLTEKPESKKVIASVYSWINPMFKNNIKTKTLIKKEYLNVINSLVYLKSKYPDADDKQVFELIKESLFGAKMGKLFNALKYGKIKTIDEETKNLIMNNGFISNILHTVYTPIELVETEETKKYVKDKNFAKKQINLIKLNTWSEKSPTMINNLKSGWKELNRIGRTVPEVKDFQDLLMLYLIGKDSLGFRSDTFISFLGEEFISEISGSLDRIMNGTSIETVTGKSLAEISDRVVNGVLYHTQNKRLLKTLDATLKDTELIVTDNRLHLDLYSNQLLVNELGLSEVSYAGSKPVYVFPKEIGIVMLNEMTGRSAFKLMRLSELRIDSDGSRPDKYDVLEHSLYEPTSDENIALFNANAGTSATYEIINKENRTIDYGHNKLFPFAVKPSLMEDYLLSKEKSKASKKSGPSGLKFVKPSKSSGSENNAGIDPAVYNKIMQAFENGEGVDFALEDFSETIDNVNFQDDVSMVLDILIDNDKFKLAAKVNFNYDAYNQKYSSKHLNAVYTGEGIDKIDTLVKNVFSEGKSLLQAEKLLTKGLSTILNNPLISKSDIRIKTTGIVDYKVSQITEIIKCK